ncbi:hypothetical protein VTL71DRAFT_13501 [Oculimacula yallundae]|uniref:Uncharacterized protein n=1 Tax=Oculimacula yallundae TaxID=86028 RepID=A0ABR4CKJ4_9HELO
MHAWKTASVVCTCAQREIAASCMAAGRTNCSQPARLSFPRIGFLPSLKRNVVRRLFSSPTQSHSALHPSAPVLLPCSALPVAVILAPGLMYGLVLTVQPSLKLLHRYRSHLLHSAALGIHDIRHKTTSFIPERQRCSTIVRPIFSPFIWSSRSVLEKGKIIAVTWHDSTSQPNLTTPSSFGFDEPGSEKAVKKCLC